MNEATNLQVGETNHECVPVTRGPLIGSEF